MAATNAQLRGRAQRLSDTENDTAISTSEWTEHINDAYRDLWDLLIEAHGDRFAATSQTFALTVSGNTYTIPVGLRRVRAVCRVTGSGLDDFFEVPRINWQDRGTTSRLGYRLIGRVLSVWPAASCAGNYRLEYTGSPTALSADGDAIADEVDEWSEYIVLRAAITAKQRSEQDASLLMDRLYNPEHGLLKRIRALAADVDDGRPDTVIDAYADRAGIYQLPNP